MASHILTHDRRQRPAFGWMGRNGLLRLGAPHFLVLVGILGGLLGLIAMVFYLSLNPR